MKRAQQSAVAVHAHVESDRTYMHNYVIGYCKCGWMRAYSHRQPNPLLWFDTGWKRDFARSTT